MARSSESEETFLQFVIDVLINSVVIILVFFLLKAFVVAPFKVDGASMVDTLHHKEYILVSKIEYLIGDPQRGDIIVFHPPVDEEQYYIKRIIGIPGDVVELKKGSVFVNGQKLQEEYLKEGLETCVVPHIQDCTGDNASYTVPEDHYFVLGDNRTGSSDSRSWHDDRNETLFVSRDQIQGKTRFVVFPFPALRWLAETNAFDAVSAPAVN